MKASPFRKIICGLLCFFLMIFFLIVFIKKEETPSDTMSICTDELMYPHIQNMTKYYQMAIDQQALFEITVIPSSGAEKEAVCKKLRTELMSGKGKDIYLLTDQATQGSSGSGEVFLPDVNKTLYSGVWADLTDYISQDEVFRDCFQPVMAAGKAGVKQYVLPLTFDFNGIKLDGRCGRYEELVELDDLDPYTFLLNPASWLGGTIDYEKEKCRITKEEIQEFLTHVTEKIRRNPASYQDTSVISMYFEATMESDTSAFSCTYYAVPSITKKICAKIQSYGAIGRSCRQKEKAYQFLRLFWLEDFANGKGIAFQAEGTMSFCSNAIYMIGGIPVQMSQWEAWFTNSLSRRGQQKNAVLMENAANFKKAAKTVSMAEFKNTLDRIEGEIQELFLDENGYQIRADWPDLESRVEKAASILYGNIYYMALE